MLILLWRNITKNNLGRMFNRITIPQHVSYWKKPKYELKQGRVHEAGFDALVIEGCHLLICFHGLVILLSPKTQTTIPWMPSPIISWVLFNQSVIKNIPIARALGYFSQMKFSLYNWLYLVSQRHKHHHHNSIIDKNKTLLYNK